MKKILTAFLIAILTTSVYAADFADTTLDAPETVVAPATTYKLYSFHWYSYQMIGKFNKFDASGNIVAQVDCVIEDWSEVTVPASCSDPQYTNQTDCENAGEVWTAATIVEHTDFSNLHNAVIAAGKVGQTYRSVVAKALNNTCMGSHYLDFAGTVE